MSDLGKGHHQWLVRIYYWVYATVGIGIIVGTIEGILWVTGVRGLAQVLKSFSDSTSFFHFITSLILVILRIAEVVGILTMILSGVVIAVSGLWFLIKLLVARKKRV